MRRREERTHSCAACQSSFSSGQHTLCQMPCQPCAVSVSFSSPSFGAAETSADGLPLSPLLPSRCGWKPHSVSSRPPPAPPPAFKRPTPLTPPPLLAYVCATEPTHERRLARGDAAHRRQHPARRGPRREPMGGSACRQIWSPRIYTWTTHSYDAAVVGRTAAGSRDTPLVAQEAGGEVRKEPQGQRMQLPSLSPKIRQPQRQPGKPGGGAQEGVSGARQQGHTHTSSSEGAARARSSQQSPALQRRGGRGR